MNYDQFLQSIQTKQLPKGISIYLTAMWYDGCEQWDKAHNCVDSLSDATACWVHAYLHRKEGDIWNADYWYSRAKKERPSVSLQNEWATIVKALL
nr:hypothetical protein [uncultured Lacibacter sp.]